MPRIAPLVGCVVGRSRFAPVVESALGDIGSLAKVRGKCVRVCRGRFGVGLVSWPWYWLR